MERAKKYTVLLSFQSRLSFEVTAYKVVDIIDTGEYMNLENDYEVRPVFNVIEDENGNYSKKLLTYEEYAMNTHRYQPFTVTKSDNNNNDIIEVVCWDEEYEKRINELKDSILYMF